MSERRSDRRRRRAALYLLVAFIGLPVPGSWALAPRDGPVDAHPAIALLKSRSGQAPQSGPKLRRGWIRKALLPRTAIEVPGERVRTQSVHAPGLRDWEALPSQKPTATMRLEFCPEHTKPDSLRIRLMGTPKNHRSPPA